MLRNIALISLAFMILMLGTRVFPAGAATVAPSGTKQKSASPPAVATQEACLDCHGPFDKLAAATVVYTAPSGEKITPHRFVPHDSKEAKAIPRCNNCHEPHPLPPTASALAGLPKPEVQWCYTACHHTNNFAPCKDCHK